MSEKITIRYESPANDPFKVPRPHRVTFEDELHKQTVEGGEVGEVALLLGVCPTIKPTIDNWNLVHADEIIYLLEDDAHAFDGWFAQFGDGKGNMFGYKVPIETIEIEAIEKEV